MAASLPVALRQHGLDMRIMTPLYQETQQSGVRLAQVLGNVQVALGDTNYTADVFEGNLGGAVPVYFIKCDAFFDRPGLYGSESGPFPDNAERFIFFCRCVLDVCMLLDFAPDVIHCNDWQTGLVPVYLRHSWSEHPYWQQAATVFTVHNAAYQGQFEARLFALTGLPESLFTVDGLEFWGKMNIMKGALVCSDVINTVSKKYSREIQTAEHGCGLEGIFRNRNDALFGIVNGVDYATWNPQTDALIAARYTLTEIAGKRRCKKDLLKLFGLSAALLERPLLGTVSRLVDQKGFDLLRDIMDELMQMDIGFVLLGTGERRYQDFFAAQAERYPDRVGAVFAYDDRMAHQIEAGCDMFLMPSRYEPCGLNQIYSLKYGTVPIVRATGGLDDTIIDYAEGDRKSGNGFKFKDYSCRALLETIERACELFQDPMRWRALMMNCMSVDFSWETSAKEYTALYERAIAAKRQT